MATRKARKDIINGFVVEDDAEVEELCVLLRKKCQVSNQGSLYIYRVNEVKVATDSDKEWNLVKVGISKPGKIADRLIGESRFYDDHTGLPIRIPGKDAAIFTRAPARCGTISAAKRLRDDRFLKFVHEQWSEFPDLAFVGHMDIGREDEVRMYPTGLGLDIGTAQCTTMTPEGFKTKKGNLKAKSFRLWLTKKFKAVAQAPTISLGESEFVLLPKAVIDDLHAERRSSIEDIIGYCQAQIVACPITYAELEHGNTKLRFTSETWPQ